MFDNHIQFVSAVVPKQWDHVLKLFVFYNNHFTTYNHSHKVNESDQVSMYTKTKMIQ